MQTALASWDRLNRVALIGSYLPRRCGIATFTADLSESLARAAPSVDFWAVAMNDRPEGYVYPHRVKFEVNANRRSDYRLAADFLNLGNVDVVCLQHEYGIFGDRDGELVLELLGKLRIPVIVTLHTVLKDPSSRRRKLVAKIAEITDRLIVMSELAAELLQEVYRIPEDKIAKIPHGIHDVPFADPNYYKDLFAVEGKEVLLTFGLLSPSKGIEGMIDALPEVVAKHPDAVYVVLGATHPAVKLEQGEDYRHSLQRRAAERGVSDHVIFHNKFVELQELKEFLGAADVYITPYPNEAQIVSGTLAYAMGSGKATVSTPYWYAMEMLAEDRGLLVPFEDQESLAAAVIELLDNEVQRHAMRKRAYLYTRQMCWSEVAARYLDVFTRVQEQRSCNPRPIHQREKLRERTLDLAEIKLDHLEVLTDDTGIYQHARFNVPRRDHGYCTDDNARALIVAVRAADHVVDTARLPVSLLAGRYLSFLEHALNEETGRFRNYMSFDRRWLEEAGSEDSHGRALWALGATEGRSKVQGHTSLAAELFQRALPAVLEFNSPRGWAYSLLGIHEHLSRFSGDSQAKRIRDELASRLFDGWQQTATDDWPWIEEVVTYANGRLVEALLLSGRWTFREEMVQQALRSLGWLIDVQTSPKGHFEPVGCNGWYPRSGQKALFDQQPIEAAGMIDACLEAYSITKDRSWSKRAQWCFGWFLGDNDLRQPICNERTGGSNDALSPDGLNANRGAESTISWLMSLLSMYELLLDDQQTAGGDDQHETISAPQTAEDDAKAAVAYGSVSGTPE